MNMEREAVTGAIGTLRDLPGLIVDVVATEGPPPARPDMILEVRSRSGRTTYLAEARTSVRSSTIGAVLDNLERLRGTSGHHPLLLANYVAPSAAERLLSEGFEFADAAGNIYLNSPAAYVLVRGNRPERVPMSTEFTPADLQLMFAFLARSDLTRATYREMAASSGLSLGKISGTVKKLEAAGYLGRDRTGALFLADPRRMLERWEFGYLERLRPTLNPTGYRPLGPAGFRHVIQAAADIPGVLLGGEHAAARLTGTLHPSTLTLHVPAGEAKDVAARLKLARSAEEPTVTLLNRFGPSAGSESQELDRFPSEPTGQRETGIANPILVRAELLATGDDRLLEVAARLKGDAEDEMRS